MRLSMTVLKFSQSPRQKLCHKNVKDVHTSQSIKNTIGSSVIMLYPMKCKSQGLQLEKCILKNCLLASPPSHKV